MHLVDHLTELRRRVIWIAAVLVLAMIGGLAAANPLITYLKDVGPAASLTLHVFSPWDGMRIWIQFSFMIALAVTLPFILYQIWAFVKPGLSKQEQKATIKYIPMAVLLFFSGLAFGYFLLFPMAFGFMLSINNQLGVEETFGMADRKSVV